MEEEFSGEEEEIDQDIQGVLEGSTKTVQIEPDRIMNIHQLKEESKRELDILQKQLNGIRQNALNATDEILCHQIEELEQRTHDATKRIALYEAEFNNQAIQKNLKEIEEKDAAFTDKLQKINDSFNSKIEAIKSEIHEDTPKDDELDLLLATLSSIENPELAIEHATKMIEELSQNPIK